MTNGDDVKALGGPYLAAAAAVGVALVVLAVAFLAVSPTRREDFAIEAAKAAMQVLPLAFFGVVVAEAVRRRDERRALRSRRDELRQRVLAEVVVAYSRAKSIRRTLRSTGLGSDRKGPLTEHQIEQLDMHMAALNEAQLDLERLEREVGARRDVFRRADEIRASLERLDHYLRDVINDWETGRRDLRPGVDAATLATWSNLRAFAAGREDHGDFNRAAEELHAIKRAVESDLLRDVR